MRKLKYLLAAAALGSLVALPQSSTASPLASGLTSAGPATSEITDGLIQKVHGYHCTKRKGWYRGKTWWHSHKGACNDDKDKSRGSNYRPSNCSPVNMDTWSDFVRCGYDPPFWARNRGMVSD
jgi:hypothetical protein